MRRGRRWRGRRPLCQGQEGAATRLLLLLRLGGLGLGGRGRRGWALGGSGQQELVLLDGRGLQVNVQQGGAGLAVRRWRRPCQRQTFFQDG